MNSLYLLSLVPLLVISVLPDVSSEDVSSLPDVSSEEIIPDLIPITRPENTSAAVEFPISRKGRQVLAYLLIHSLSHNE